MTAPSAIEIEHGDIWNLLPWLVNGRLSDADRTRVEAHLVLCSACREEHALQRRIYEVLAAEAPFEQLPTAGLNKLHRRLELDQALAGRLGSMASASQAAPNAPATAVPSAAHPTRRVRNRWHRSRSLAASLTAIALVVGFAAARYGHRGPAPDYHTVTSAAPQYPEAVIRAVFSPTVTLAKLQALLDAAHLRIVSGPTEAGVYSLAMNGSPSMAWSLQHLRAQDGVRFAEAIAPTPDPPPP